MGIKIPAGNGFPAVEIPAAPEPWNFESWFADATARREGQDMFEEVKALDAKATPEDFQLDVGGDCMGWDRVKLYKRLGREPSAPPAKSPKGAVEASPSPQLFTSVTLKVVAPTGGVRFWTASVSSSINGCGVQTKSDEPLAINCTSSPSHTGSTGMMTGLGGC